MSQIKLLKSPARMLLLTFVLSVRMSAAHGGGTPQLISNTMHGQRSFVTTRGRSWQEVTRNDYTRNHGIERWGLNE